MTEQPRLIKVAVLVPADTKPKDLGRVLDLAFEDRDEVLEFSVEGHGTYDVNDPTTYELLVFDETGHMP
jgi:hypothetical protein